VTVVFVHGVPETAAIWDPLIAAMGGGDVVALSPPGFGAPVPEGFDATSDAYIDWLVAELERFETPVDLVGHDWGGVHVMRVATRRPDLVRSMVTDIAGTGDGEYVWHDLAQVWQTPGDGEAFVETNTSASIADRTAMLVGAGMTQDGARACAEANNAAMGACILELYRSAVQPRMTEWADEFAALPDRPRTLVIIPTDDHYTGGEQLARRTAERWGAEVAVLDDLGHWWMMNDPDRGAAALRGFLDAATG
jgi:pimeloyl-ACP methyl ester carboxylesterase